MIEGVVVKELNTFSDERGFFRELVRFDDCRFFINQASYGMRATGTATGWHIHQHLKEVFCVTRGIARIVLKDCRVGTPVKTTFVYREPQKVFMVEYGLSQTPNEYMEIVLGGHMPKSIVIPFGVAHGYKILQGECDMLYFASQTYDVSRNDEGRIEPDRWPEHNWMREIEVK